jgi:hypothetical protein
VTQSPEDRVGPRQRDFAAALPAAAGPKPHAASPPDELLELARDQGVEGRSEMSEDELRVALGAR